MVLTVDVPEYFQHPDRHAYPPDNIPDFEFWFMNQMKNCAAVTNRIYLPILFTSYYKRNEYGKNLAAIDILQKFVDSLDRYQKYFCVVQYDDGTMINWRDKDVLIFSMSGKDDNAISIPLVCQPHPDIRVGKDILFSFVGRVTDPRRAVIVGWGHDKTVEKDSIYISSKPHSLSDYCHILARSVFVLCPRGYGASSFRVAESLQYGAMPYCIQRAYDKVFERQMPFSIHQGIFQESDMGDIGMYMLRNKGLANPDEMRCLHQKHYTFEAVKQQILQALWDSL